MKTTLSELKAAYEKETGQKITPQAAARTLRRVGGSRVKRFEQLYWCPYEKNEPSANGIPPIEPSPPMHSSHRYRFSIAYEGKQPTDGIRKPWGRTRKQEQVIFNFGANLKVVAFSRHLRIFLSSPKGETTQEQGIAARKEAYLAIMGFAKEHNIKLLGDLEQKLWSHHVLELGNRNLKTRENNPNGVILDAFDGAEKELAEIVGSGEDNSHRGKLEHFNISKNYRATPKERAENFEWLLAGFRRQYEESEGRNAERWAELEGQMALLRAENAKLAEALALIIETIRMKKL